MLPFSSHAPEIEVPRCQRLALEMISNDADWQEVREKLRLLQAQKPVKK
jgi:hypothetical protein